MGWVLRVFQLRKRSLMLMLLKSVVIPLLEYCCQLLNPWKAKDIQAIYRSYSTNVNKQNYGSAVKLLGMKLQKLTLYSLMTT